jgi:hypothetical protein
MNVRATLSNGTTVKANDGETMCIHYKFKKINVYLQFSPRMSQALGYKIHLINIIMYMM